MTKTNMDLFELLAKHEQGDFLRAVAEAVLKLIMEADAEGLIGAGKHERADQRTTWRNGCGIGRFSETPSIISLEEWDGVTHDKRSKGNPEEVEGA